MKTVLLSTSNLWNCGDDFIRDGVLELLNLKPDCRTLWWNRGYGISSTYANDLNVNLSHIDYFIMAGTPQWIFRNEAVYKYCLKKAVPMSIIGVGTRGFFTRGQRDLMKRVAESGLCELVTARDEVALETLRDLGFKDPVLMLDPAFFMKPLNSTPELNILGWRYQYGKDDDPTFPYKHFLKYLRRQQISFVNRRKRTEIRAEYDKYMFERFSELPEPKMLVVHDNREIKEAEKIFGKEYVFYSSDYHEILKKYASAKTYIGSRLHGAIPAIIHGASVRLEYFDRRWKALEAAISILSNHMEDVDKKIKLNVFWQNKPSGTYQSLEPLDKNEISSAIQKEKEKIFSLVKSQKILSEFISE